MPPTMKAAVLPAYGEPLRVTSLPRPQPGAGQVLVRVHASGVNPLDTKIQAGAAAHAKQPASGEVGAEVGPSALHSGLDLKPTKRSDSL